MMRMTATVEFRDGRRESRPIYPWSICEVEAATGKSFSKIVGDNLQREVCQLAWHAFTEGADEYAAWMRTVADVEIEVGGGAVDPTPPTPGATRQRRSRS